MRAGWSSSTLKTILKHKRKRIAFDIICGYAKGMRWSVCAKGQKKRLSPSVFSLIWGLPWFFLTISGWETWKDLSPTFFKAPKPLHVLKNTWEFNEIYEKTITATKHITLSSHIQGPSGVLYLKQNHQLTRWHTLYAKMGVYRQLHFLSLRYG